MYHNRAFSLVELSIVLVILGLLVGGILTGQSLIRAAEMRSLTTQMQTIVAATHTFRSKYMALPGDMTNATSFWTAANADPTTCRTTASTGKETCDGDGDGRIGFTSTYHYERFRYWQHLANAGLIEGSFTGIAGSGNTYHVVPGQNAPVAKLGGDANAIGMLQRTPVTSSSSVWAHSYGNILTFGKRNDPNDAWDAALTSEETWNIDKKMDDGLPSKGRVLTFKNVVTNNPSCHTSQTDASAEYNVSNTGINCSMIFISGY